MINNFSVALTLVVALFSGVILYELKRGERRHRKNRHHQPPKES